MYKFLTLLIMMFLSFSGAYAAEQSTEIINYSGSEIEEPYWFKDSFLELGDDIQEAEDEGKSVLLYFHQAGCPYCYNLVQQSFLDPQLSVFIQENFDIIALNLWGDREVTLPNGEVLTEKELAVKWKVQFTPTLIFYTGEFEPRLRIDGYRSKAMLAKVLDYVVSGSQEQFKAQQIVNGKHDAALYPSSRFVSLRTQSQYSVDKPTVVLFEYPGCADCEALHKTVISRKDTDQLLSQYNTLRVDVSDEKSLLPLADQSMMIGKKWAETLGLTYFPSLVLFDENNQEQLRIDGFVRSFHLQAALEYVGEKIYQQTPEFQRYINERADNFRKANKKVVITD